MTSTTINGTVSGTVVDGFTVTGTAREAVYSQVRWRPDLDRTVSEYGAWTIERDGRAFKLYGPHDFAPSFLLPTVAGDMAHAQELAQILIAAYHQRVTGRIRPRPRPYRRRACPTC